MGGEQCSNASSWRPLETLARVAKIRTQTSTSTNQKTKTRQRECGDASYSTLRCGNRRAASGAVSFTDGIASFDTKAIAVRSVVYREPVIPNQAVMTLTMINWNNICKLLSIL